MHNNEFLAAIRDNMNIRLTYADWLEESGYHAAANCYRHDLIIGGECLAFVPLPKGTFYMGWNDERKGTKTEIKEDFEIAIYTVTQALWQAIMGNNPSWFSREGNGKERIKEIADDDLKQFPVEQVSWNDVHEFIRKLNNQEISKGWEYRLPTVVEWEYACRGGSTSKKECSYHFYLEKPTNDLSSKQANFAGDSPAGDAPQGPYLVRTTKVGSYPANKLGLYDMHGNVFEWCKSLDYDFFSVWRGGGWFSNGPDCVASLGMFEQWHPPETCANICGFRLARVRARG